MSARVIDLASRRADAADEVVTEDDFVAAFSEYVHGEESLALVHPPDGPARVALLVGDGAGDRRIARGLVMDAATARTLGFALISISARARRDADARERAERSGGDGT